MSFLPARGNAQVNEKAGQEKPITRPVASSAIAARNRTAEALRQTKADLARISRVTAMGEPPASLALEVSQPIASAVADANTCLRWLTRDQLDLGAAREAASRMVRDAARAAEIVTRA